MEMIDVLKKLEEIAQTRPELVKDAVDNVSRTNPVTENPLMALGVAAAGGAGNAIGNRIADKLGAGKKPDSNMIKKDEGGMSDVHIGAQEVVGEYADEDGNLKMPKADVLRAMAAEKAKAAFPLSYEIEIAMGMVQDKFDDAGQSQENSPAFPSYTDGQEESEVPTQEPEALEGNAFADAVQKAKAAGMKKGDKFKVGDEEHTLRDSDFEGVNTNDMKTESKTIVKESIQISADTPQEASMMMQLLKLAGVQQVDQDMINQEPEAPAENPAHGEEGHVCGDGEDDAIGSGEMGRMRDMMTAPAEEKAEETFANSMGDEKEEPKYQDTDTLVNFHSGGLNSQKQQVRKEYPGDNPLAVKEDTITEVNLADSLRAQYEGFKAQYQEAAKPDFLDMDKDGNKKEPMKKAIKDKEAK
jgi:hypothetical protein